MTELRCRRCGKLLARRLTPARGETVEIKCPRCRHVNIFGRETEIAVDGLARRSYAGFKN